MKYQGIAGVFEFLQLTGVSVKDLFEYLIVFYYLEIKMN